MIQKSKVSLSKVASVFNGKTPSKTDQRSNGHPVLKIKDVSETGRFEGIFESFVNADFAEKFNEKKIVDEDILILNAAHNADYVGTKIYKAEKCVEGALATGEWMMIRTDKAALDSRYAYYWFLNTHTRYKVRQLVKGIHLYPKDVARLEIPLPPLEEQSRIAAILDKADAVRRKRQRAIALTEELLRAAFLDMFSDPVKNPSGWEKINFGELVPGKGQIVDGPFGSSLKPECYVSSGVRVVRNFNIQDDFFNGSDFVYVTKEKFAEIRRSNVHLGDLLLSTKGTVGNICIMPDLAGESVLSASGTVRIRLPKNSPLLAEFVVQQMIQPNYKQYMKWFVAGTNQKYLNLSGIRKMELIVPPIALQHKFISMRKETLALKNKQEQVFSESHSFFNSLLQQAFRGEL